MPARKKTARGSARRAGAHKGRTVFVAYPYGIADKRDYRKPFLTVGRAYNIQFIFADERISNESILTKIVKLIQSADFSLFDITQWNPNVTLELGIALMHSDDWYVLFNPRHGQADAPSDIRGIEQIRYESFAGLEEQLMALMDQRYGKAPAKVPEISDHLERLTTSIRDLLKDRPGLTIADMSLLLKIGVPVAQLALRPLIEAKAVSTKGRKRGMRYFLR
jgi:predicted nucleotide-binding protein